MQLNRSDAILKYIVEYFIKYAQPVGSHTLIEEYGLKYSSATVRNEMFALEKMGFIEKAHTSGGRIPSAKGYRYYCDNLIDQKVDDYLKYSLQTVLSEKVKSIEEVMKASCEILSHMTSLVSVVSGKEDNERLASAQLIQIAPNTLTAVFVTDQGYVENKTFVIPDNINAEEIVKCMSLLNDRLKGTPIPNLVEKMEALKPVLSEYVISHDVIYQALMETFMRFASDRINLYGREQLFNNPEFKNDAEKLERVFKLLTNNSLIKEVKKDEEDKDFVLRIGDIDDNPDVSIVSKKINLGGKRETSITLVGPTRMDYSKALSALDYLSEELNKYFEELDKGGNRGE